MILRNFENVTFTGVVVYVTGNHYVGCTFDNCTLVFHGTPVGFEKCVFHSNSSWRIEFTVHDPDQWDQFMSIVASAITRSLPKAPPAS